MSRQLGMARYDSAPSADAGGTVFEVLEGEGRFMMIFETDNRTGVDDGATEVRWFEEIFAAPGARPLAESSRYVFTISIEVDPDVSLEEFHHWYDHTHVPVVATAGLLGGRRFRDLDHERRFLATYDMADRDTLASETLAKVRGFDHFTGKVGRIQRHVLEREGAR